MPLMNDRPRIPVLPPRPPEKGRLQMLPGDPRDLRERVADPAYAPFWEVVTQCLSRARKVDLASARVHEESRAASAKALALSHWATGSARDAALARKALLNAATGHWQGWCGCGDVILDYLVAADLLRAAGRFSTKDVAHLRDRITPKIEEAHGVAHDLPQNNWRIGADTAAAAGALFFWHDPGRLNVQELLASGLDGLSRILFGILTPEGANEEGINYSRRCAIPVVRLAWAYRQMTGNDLLNRPDLRRWHRWQLEIKRPDGRMWPLDDSDEGYEFYPHGLLVNRAYRDAALQRWAHDRAPRPKFEWAGEAMLLFDKTIRPKVPDWPPSRVLPEAGVAIFRTGWDSNATMALLVARPLTPFGADQVNTAHKHDDPTNFLLHSHGRLLVTEGGYGGGGYSNASRHDYFLAGAAHNMILVDGQGPLRVTSHNSDSRHGNTSQSAGRVREICRTRDLYGAQAETSYQNVDFRRSLFMVRGRYFVMIDEVEGARTHEYSWLLHGAGQSMEYASPDGALWKVGPARLAAYPVIPTSMPWRHLKAAGTDHDLTNLHRIAAEHMVLRAWTCGRSVRFVSVIVPDAADAALPQIAVISQDPVALSIKVDGMTSADLFIWQAGGGRARVPGHGVVTLKAPAAVLRQAVAL